MMKNLLYTAIRKSLTGKFLTYAVQFLALSIYARIFTPEQFGIIASLQVFVVFFQLFADIGIGPAIINENNFSKEQRNGVFTVTFIIGLFLAVVFYFFSFFLERFYNEFKYEHIAIIISISIVFFSLNIVPLTTLIKDSEFLKIAKIDCFVEIASFFLVFILYELGFGLYALVAKNLSQSSLRFFSMWYVSKNRTIGRPNLGSGIYHIRSLFKFAIYQFGFNFINYFSRNLDKILIGKFFGGAALGVYEKSYQLMQYPLMLTTFAMTPAIQPVLTKMRANLEYIIEEHNKLTIRLFCISVIISIIVFFNAQSIVLVLFGEQWGLVAPLIKIFCFIIPIQAVLSTSGSFFQVMNRTDLLFISGVISAIFNVTAIIIGLYLGSLNSICIALCISFSINFFQCYFILFRYCFRTSSYRFFAPIIKIFVIILLIILFIYR